MEMLRVVERIGPCTCKEIVPHMTVKKHGPVAGACWYGANYGLLTVVPDSKPKQFKVAHDWRDQVAARQVAAASRATPLKQLPEAKRPTFTVASALASRSPLEQAWANYR